MKGLVKITARPRLKTPVMIAAWPGIGNVSTIAANYLKYRLDFKKLAEVNAAWFFDPIGVSVRENLVEAPQFPQSEFYYWKNDQGGPDIILFQGDDQPAAKSYDMAHCIIDFSEKMKVETIYTFAAAMTRIHHTEPSRLWVVATTPEVSAELRQYSLERAANLQIAGLNGLLMGVAKERNFRGVCLLGEVPTYASRVQNPRAALTVLQTMAGILGLTLDFSELESLSVEATERMKQMTARAMEEYIDFFTEPIWESDDEDEEDEE